MNVHNLFPRILNAYLVKIPEIVGGGKNFDQKSSFWKWGKDNKFKKQFQKIIIKISQTLIKNLIHSLVQTFTLTVWLHFLIHS